MYKGKIDMLPWSFFVALACYKKGRQRLYIEWAIKDLTKVGVESGKIVRGDHIKHAK